MATTTQIIDATWPAAAIQNQGPWILRRGDGAGSRVSAATATAAVASDDLDQAEAAMRTMGQTPLFMIRPQDATLDHDLEVRGYRILDPVNVWACPVADLLAPMPSLTVFPVWEPLAVMNEIWDQGGIGPARRAVMVRATGPKTALLGRADDAPVGAAFVAVAGDTAMLHALEVLPQARRQGLGGWMMRGAALWAQAQGATRMTVLCTQANDAANRLYSSLGMCVVDQYHYRTPHKEETT